MRPTLLKFRNPKEETGGYVYPTMTRRGNSLENKAEKSKSTFPREGRFKHVDTIARRTGFNIGPGAYNVNLSTNKGVHPKIMKESAVERINCQEWDYTLVNDSIIKVRKPHSRTGSMNSSSYGNSSCYSSSRNLRAEYNQELKHIKETREKRGLSAARILAAVKEVSSYNTSIPFYPLKNRNTASFGAIVTEETRPTRNFTRNETIHESPLPYLNKNRVILAPKRFDQEEESYLNRSM